MAQRLKRLPRMREIRVQSLGREDGLEKEMATYSSTLAWRIQWREESDIYPYYYLPAYFMVIKRDCVNKISLRGKNELYFLN